MPETNGKDSGSSPARSPSVEATVGERGTADRGAAADRPGEEARIHESSYVEDDVNIGDGTRIRHFSHVREGAVIGRGCSIGQNVEVGPGVRIGDGVKIQNNVSVYEGVTLEDHVFCGPSMVFTNVHNPRSEIQGTDEDCPTHVHRGATFGANCTVLCGIEVGEYAFVGAGAVVTRDVPAYALVVGNPARVAGWTCRCGNRIEFPDGQGVEGRCGECGRRYRKEGERTVVPADCPG